MNRWIILALLFASLPAWGITVIDAASAFLPNTVSGTVTINITSTSSGDEIVLCAVNPNNNTFAAGAFTDSGSQTYTLVWNNIHVGSNASAWICGYKENSASGITSVSVTESSSGGHGAFWVYHLSGTATSGSLDTNTTGFSGPGAGSWTSGSINTAQASEIAIGAAYCLFNGANCTMTAGAGWTNSVVPTPGSNFDGNNGGDAAMSAQVLSSIQTGLTYTGTTPASTNSYAGIMAFKAAGGGGGATPAGSKAKKLLKLDMAIVN